MRTTSLLIMIFLTTIMYAQDKATTIYLIRHAEKADATPNTNLSIAGNQRAKNWAKYFSGKKIAAVYSTDYKRTLQTAEPVAKQAGTEVQKYKHHEFDLKKLAAENAGKMIVVVGHSNTLPGYVNSALGKNMFDEIDESEFGTLFEVVIENGKASARQIIVPFQISE